MWSESEPPLADRSHAQVIAAAYPDLAPLPLGSTSPAEASELVVSAMEEMGFDQVTADAETGRIEGVAETFWFGFKDDMVVRIADGAIDFRSVSRVGVSDLGANAHCRLARCRCRTAQSLNWTIASALRWNTVSTHSAAYA
jgi:fatty-acyl-CoA synthase